MYILADVIKSLQKVFFGILAILAGISLIVGAAYLVQDARASTYDSNFKNIPAVNKLPHRAARWKFTPTVIICEHAPISQAQIKSAVQFWKKLGHRFYRTQYKHDPQNKCLEKQPTGYIVIHMVTQGIGLENNSLAQTHFFVDNDSNKIEWAIIYMRSDIKETVLEHEIGHALGYLHYDKINHLMNSKWMHGGWDVDGLRN